MVLFCLLAVTTVETGLAQRYGGRFAPRVRSFGITGEGGVAVMGCDLTSIDDNYYFEPMGGVEFGFLASQNFKIGAYFSRGIMVARQHGDDAENTFNAIGITGHYYFRLSWGRVNPFLFFRAGGLFTNAEANYNNVHYSQTANGAVFGGGAGVEFHPSNIVGIRFQAGGMCTSTDHLDALDTGTMEDGYSTLTLGITYYFQMRR